MSPPAAITAMSLKSALPALADVLDMTTAALYERQRALVRAGLLQARPGRGPGSGVPVDAKSVAMLLMSILATGSLSEVEEWTRLIARMRPKRGVCPLTSKRKFAEALAAALSSGQLHKVEVERSASKTWMLATLSYLGDGPDSYFGFGDVPPPTGLSVKTTIWYAPLDVAHKLTKETSK